MSPRTKEQNDEIRERRKLQIIETAETLFLTKGMNLDIRDVAQTAGLGYGTVYHYYNNKHLLIHDIMEAGFAAAAETTEQLSSVSRSPLALLKSYLQSLPDSWTRSRASFAVYKQAAENFAMFEPDLQLLYNKRFEQHIYFPLAVILEQAIRKQELPAKLDPHQTANMLLGSLIGAYSIYWSHNNRRFDAGFTADVLIKGLVEV